MFGFSREVNSRVMKDSLGDVFKSVQIFSICIRKANSRYFKANNDWIPKIFEQVNSYLELVIQHLKSFFEERQLIVTFDTSRTNVLVHGNRPKYLMEGKANIKNALESMVCLFVKDTHIDGKTMLKYLKKATLYPVHFSKFNSSTAVVVTKDNILRQLISKSANFMKYLGLEESS